MKRLLPMILCAGCASAQTQSGDDLLDSGGAIAVAEMPAANPQIMEHTLVVWGMTEVPVHSRMQAAEAMVDAITRAELLKFVQVGVGSMQLDVEVLEAGITHQQIEVITAEVVQARLPSATLIQHGWEKTRDEDGTEVLRLVGRLEITRELLRDTLAEKLPAQADAIVTHLFRKR